MPALQRIAVLIMSNVFIVHQRSESGDVAQIVSKSVLSKLIPSEHAHMGTTWVFGGQLGFAWANLLGPKWA